MTEYEQFIASKKYADVQSGFDCDVSLNQHGEYKLKDFQVAIVNWALKRGRAAIFADTGLGKTAMQVTWANEVVKYTGKNVLILAPLCVAQQTVQEASRFGIEVNYCRSQSQVKHGITITNYEMLEHFDTDSFLGVVLDESSILKSVTGKTRKQITDLFQMTPYRLSCTATPSPNDYMELGNQAEFLGIMSAVEMLAMFFTHDGGETSKWRLKGHGKVKFWEWMSTWAVSIKSPEDLGFDGSEYKLPPLKIHEHVVSSREIMEGQLFPCVAQTLSERRQAKRGSLNERVELAASIANGTDKPVIVWCHLNDESQLLSKAINGAVEVTGSMTIVQKEKAIMGFTNGENRVLDSKPSICGFGMNWQHCDTMIFAGLDDSFESFYQAVRRCWRFGQKNPVNVHIITADTEGAVKANIERKQRQAENMASEMVAYMREFTKQKIVSASNNTEKYSATIPAIIPEWIYNNVENV